MNDAILWIIVALAGGGVGYGIHSIVSRMKFIAAERNGRIMMEDARRESESLLREAQLQAKDEVLKAREEFEKQNWSRRQEMIALEERIVQRETSLDRKVSMLDKKELAADQKLEEIEKEKEATLQKERELDVLIEDEKHKLQHITALSPDEAKRMLMQRMEEELRSEAGDLIRRVQKDALTTAEREARKIIASAVERYAADQINEMTTSAVTLPSDEMKGRIIGREGRNIRALEAATGVNILIDDTPEVVVISSFDPLRREIARQSLERLIADGRIHPSRIEEIVTKVQSEVDDTIRKAGEEAVYELRLQAVDPEIVKTLGRLKYRHSYGQNVLKHSVEMSNLMGMMASDLGIDPSIAKRIGLLHDIGKAMDHHVEGTHAMIGADFLKRHGESPVVCNAVAAHHNEVEAESIYAVLTKAGDAITAARPGARAETTDIYFKRLEKLEDIANNFRGVEKCYAIQAGREIRVIVEPAKIDDNEAMQMARNISKQIEHDMEYPGQIKVTVVRETRCVEYAR